MDRKELHNHLRKCESDTCVKINPVVAKTGSKIEQAARTDVMPAAVPSIVFSGIQEMIFTLNDSKFKEYRKQRIILTARLTPP